MKYIVPIIICIALGGPAFGQDVDFGLGGDASSLLNLPAPRGNTPAARGARTNAPAVDRLVRLRELFAAANLPLTKDQEAAMSYLLSVEIPNMRRTLQERIAALQKAKGTDTAPGALSSMDELAPEIIRLNDQLLGKMVMVPGLSPEQQAFTKKLYKEQVKSRGGFDAIKLTLEDAGAPFSSEQIAQIQPLFDNATTDQLKRETLARVLKLLTPAQRTALLAARN
jgi:hypothetical protein